MAATAMVHVRLDEKIKERAAKALLAMGLSISDAVRVFLTRVATDKELPFALKVPNAETRAAMAEVDEMIRQRRARFATADELFDELEKTASSKRATLPRATDLAKSFRKDWERLSHSG